MYQIEIVAEFSYNYPNKPNVLANYRRWFEKNMPTAEPVFFFEEFIGVTNISWKLRIILKRMSEVFMFKSLINPSIDYTITEVSDD